jgi:transposase
MANRTRIVIGGVDTHGRTHHAAIIDQHGRLPADAEFGADTDGYRQLLSWLRRHGQLSSVGVEGTGTYVAGLTRFLLERGVQVLEVDRPDRRTRRRRGKSDPIDAEAAARAVLAGTATALPKRRDGIVEAIRVLRAVRTGAVKARTAAINQLKAMVVTAPAVVREPLDGLSTARQVALDAGCLRSDRDPPFHLLPLERQLDRHGPGLLRPGGALVLPAWTASTSRPRQFGATSPFEAGTARAATRGRR